MPAPPFLTLGRQQDHRALQALRQGLVLTKQAGVATAHSAEGGVSTGLRSRNTCKSGRGRLDVSKVSA